MDREKTQEAFKQAQKEDREKQVGEVKKVILATLDKLRTTEKQSKELQDTIQILKQDLRDFKEGRLDRIEERQKKNPQAKKVSVVMIEKEVVTSVPAVIKEVHHYHNDWWYQPYRITWSVPYYQPAIYANSTMTLASTACGANFGTLTTTDNIYDCTTAQFTTINCSIAKDATAGTYELTNGSVKSL